MKIVLALGGNSLLAKGQKGTAEEQRKNIAKTCKAITKIMEGGNRMVITHGNGPQVGNLIIQQERAKGEVAAMPMDVCGAMSQGELGYFIQSELERVSHRTVATIITQIVVDKDDPGFRNPSKPVGPFYEEKLEEGMIMDAGRGWRKVVPSPIPQEIVEIKAITSLLDAGVVVIAAGGGGIPVFRSGETLSGLDAVIDKDRASALIGKKIGANMLVIATSIDKVYLNLGEESQRGLDRVSVSEARELMGEGHFAEGSMKPKIEACIDFVESTGGRAVICSLADIEDAIEGNAGTEITA
ncbi:MAG: carbamate kinase [Candidatus Micrarchaeia archaeon]